MVSCLNVNDPYPVRGSAIREGHSTKAFTTAYHNEDDCAINQ